MREIVRTVVADNLRAARARSRLKQEELAERMRSNGFETWSRSTVSQVEHYNRSISVEELVGLAVIFGMRATDLMCGGDLMRQLDCEACKDTGTQKANE